MAREIPKILDCEATQCIYNINGECHTPAITVGDEEPCCDTFYTAKNKGGYQDIIGGVGACKVQDCEHNKSFECSAPGIHVVMVADHPDCATYEPR